MILATLFGFSQTFCAQTLAATADTVIVTVTIGAPDNDNDGMADDWEQQIASPPMVVRPGDDADSDGVSNLHEFLLGTDPTDPGSLLQLVEVDMTNGMARLTWDSSTRTAPLPRKYDVICHDSIEDFLEAGTIILNGFPSAGARTEVSVPAGRGKFYAIKLTDNLFPK